MSGPIPPRAPEATKSALLGLIDRALEQGWTAAAACRYLELPARRYQRWRNRAGSGSLADRRPGGRPVHGLLPEEADAILQVFQDWGDIDRSHRKLAHRGSYIGRFWASPSTVRRVLALAGKGFRPAPRAPASKKRPVPDWVRWEPNRIWIYDTTHFPAAATACVAILDVVSRKWVGTVASAEETSVQVQLCFERALDAEGLDEVLEQRAADADAGFHGPHLPILLAMSDNGPQMTSGATAEFMAICSIAQHFGRPGTPTDQAWIESHFGHVKAEHPHLLKIRDAATLRDELEHVRRHYNGVRLHEAIGYVTPDDEHEGRGEAIRQARRDGMERARAARVATRRATRHTGPETRQPDDG